jgi:hypothetical protein
MAFELSLKRYGPGYVYTVSFDSEASKVDSNKLAKEVVISFDGSPTANTLPGR